jgi:hypothetical protein
MCSDRLASIPPHHLLLIGREGVFGLNNKNTSVAHVTKVLAAATKGGSAESYWLLNKLWSRGDIPPEFNNTNSTRMKWVAEIMRTEDSPWAQYYRGRALLCTFGDENAGLELLLKSAEAGFAPAMSFLGSVAERKEEGNTWICKAVELNDPDGLYELSICVGARDRKFELLCKAAALGHARSMRKLTKDFLDRLSPTEVVSFGARYVLYSGVDSVTQDAADLAMMYAAGRELEGHEQFWDFFIHPDISYLKCIRLYRVVTRRARRAALQTVDVLRRRKDIGLPRDVARLIGQFVYATRTDAWVWQKK